jgi:hypothetical protein
MGFSDPLTVFLPVGNQYNGRVVTILHCMNGRLETIVANVRSGMATFTVTSLLPFAAFNMTEEIDPDSLPVVVTSCPSTSGISGTTDRLNLLL